MKSGLASLAWHPYANEFPQLKGSAERQCMAAWDASSSLSQVTTGIYLGTTAYQEEFYDTFKSITLHLNAIMNFNRDLQLSGIMKRAKQNIPFMSTLIVKESSHGLMEG